MCCAEREGATVSGKNSERRTYCVFVSCCVASVRRRFAVAAWIMGKCSPDVGNHGKATRRCAYPVSGYILTGIMACVRPVAVIVVGGIVKQACKRYYLGGKGMVSPTQGAPHFAILLKFDTLYTT